MLFNSIEFSLFLPIVFFLYWFVFNRNLKVQNIFLIIVSYIFYGWWNKEFLILIFLSSLLDYTIGLFLSKENTVWKRKALLFISLSFNLGLLFYFKYSNFFIENFVEAFTFFGYHLSPSRLDIILPVGISFYTFQTLSYTIDVYRKKITPTKDIISFLAFVCFFPQLVAGPIERASHLLPQFYIKRNIRYSNFSKGGQYILWGLFKKVVIADNCALVVNDIFEHYASYSSLTLLIGAFFFSIQIYCDFSGYSDIAIGVARLFGFRLSKNFDFPYFSRDIAEFWRKWHISLTTWFKDYVYIPLGGSRGTLVKTIQNTFIIFLISGIWHGANWTFIIWGLLNAAYFMPLLILNLNRKNTGKFYLHYDFQSVKIVINIVITFAITTIAWIFFRANNLVHAKNYLAKLFTDLTSNLNFDTYSTFTSIIPVLLFFIIIEWINRNYNYGIKFINRFPRVTRWAFYYLLIILINLYNGEQSSFIYFQF